MTITVEAIGGSSLAARGYSPVVAATGHDIVSVDYRLAPEHPYPAAVDDGLAVYLVLAATQPVIVTGESAGGGLMLALVQRIRDEKLPMPIGTVPVFPWADFTQSGSIWTNASRDILDKDTIDGAAAMYGAGADLRTPGLSPAFGSFTGFPATLIPVGTHDSLLSDAHNLVAAMQRDGVDVLLLEMPGAAHGFLVLPVPEVRRTMAAIAEFVRECFGG